jgi:hypothetical protein
MTLSELIKALLDAADVETGEVPAAQQALESARTALDGARATVEEKETQLADAEISLGTEKGEAAAAIRAIIAKLNEELAKYTV